MGPRFNVSSERLEKLEIEPMTLGLQGFGLVLLRLNIPVNIFSVRSRWSRRFLGITSSFQGVNVSLLKDNTAEVSNPQSLALESEALPLGHRPPRFTRRGALPLHH